MASQEQEDQAAASSTSTSGVKESNTVSFVGFSGTVASSSNDDSNKFELTRSAFPISRPDLSSVRATLSKPPPKSIQEYSTHGYVFTVVVGLSMAFSAGYSNGVCLGGFLNVGADSVQQSVAGVTGVYTSSAIYLVEPDYQKMGLMFGTIFSVMFGAFISALMNPYPIAFEISPRYGPTFLLGCLFMSLGAIEALHNNRREFFFTAIANGIQNGVSSMYSANLLRTTHLTGTTTDIGLFLGMALRGNRTNNWKLYILLGLAIFFWTGSVCGYVASQVKRQNSLIFNAGFFFVLSMVVMIRACIVYHSCTKWTDDLDHLDIYEADDKGNNKRLSQDELEIMFDEIAEDGEVDQHALLAYLASHNLRVQKHRKGLVALLHDAFVTHGDGDWKINKDEWKGLIHRCVMSNQPLMPTHTTRDSILKSSRNLGLTSFNGNGASTAAASGPEALRRLSIMQLGESLSKRK